MHYRFFPLSSDLELLERQSKISQEFHVYDENMLASRFFFLSDKVGVIRQHKLEALKNNEVYIGS